MRLFAGAGNADCSGGRAACLLRGFNLTPTICPRWCDSTLLHHFLPSTFKISPKVPELMSRQSQVQGAATTLSRAQDGSNFQGYVRSGSTGGQGMSQRILVDLKVSQPQCQSNVDFYVHPLAQVDSFLLCVPQPSNEAAHMHAGLSLSPNPTKYDVF